MRVHAYSTFIFLLLAHMSSLTAQQAPRAAPEPFYYVALTDPACPVSGFTPPAPVTNEIHVLYFPVGQGATIKKPKSPVLHLVFDNGFGPDNDRTLPFTKREDSIWLATVPLKDRFPKYAVYWIEDRETKQLDTNGGNYFDVPFCDLEGRRAEWSVRYEAESYTGQLESHGVERATDYAKAIEVLDEFIHPPSRGANLISHLWKYELKLHGDTPEARSALLAEIKKFVSDHSADGFGLVDALNFAAYEDWIPPETTEALAKAIESKYPDDNPRLFILAARALKEKDRAKRTALMWELVDKYPTSREANLARNQLLLAVTDLAQCEKLYQQLRENEPENPFHPWNMASIYARGNQKLPQALALLDEADKLFDASQNKQAKIHYSESTLKDVKLKISILRSDILLRLGKPAETISVLQPLKPEFTSGSPYYLLGKAEEATGDKRAAVDAYLESVVRPSKDQQQASARLEALWSSEKLGGEQELQQSVEARLVQNFSSAKYEPRVLAHPAPEFDLTTLRGERVSSSQLRGKKVILDFWSVWCGPCLLELKALQDFQEKHPELVIATVVDAETDTKQLETVIRNRELTSLRISKAASELRDRFCKGGVPDTFIIDEKGFVRIEHLGSVPDVSRYFEADLKAIADAGPARETERTATSDQP
jgi:thiol-disulfide isomerase/thioredoxin